MLEFPIVTAMTLGATIILQTGLAMRVSMGRLKYSQLMGDGGKPEMVVRIRSHGNLAENAPIVLMTIALLEATGANSIGITVLAAVFFIARLLHPIGISMKKAPNAPRFLGTFSTYMVGIVSGGWLLLTAAKML